jgi:hypothetical protein
MKVKTSKCPACGDLDGCHHWRENVEIVINKRYGGFGLSRKAFLRLREMGSEVALKEPDIGEVWPGSKPVEVRRAGYLDSFCRDIKRDDPMLVKVVRELGEEASAPLAKLRIVSVPDGIEWEIDDYDGMETIAETHRTWD